MFEPANGPYQRGAGISRRDLLRAGSLAALGLGLPPTLRASSNAPQTRDHLSCILIWLQGGMSHLDTFDPKPEAPSHIRGEFGVIETTVPGIWLSDQLPLLAARQHRFSIVRGLNPRTGSHGVAEYVMLSGHAPTQFDAPSIGSRVARQKASATDRPPFVQLGEHLDTSFGGGQAGRLGAHYNPFLVPSAAIGSQGPARQLYHCCRHARWFIEQGTRFVTVTHHGWDTHEHIFSKLNCDLLPDLDQALSTLLDDLDARGLLDSTLVAVLTDFGRSPVLNADAGRDHCSNASIALLAGAGIRPGLVVGATDSTGSEPLTNPYVPEDLAATIYQCLGIPPTKVLPNAEGRRVPILPAGQPIQELF